jgi:hypothetical protein
MNLTPHVVMRSDLATVKVTLGRPEFDLDLARCRKKLSRDHYCGLSGYARRR